VEKFPENDPLDGVPIANCKIRQNPRLFVPANIRNARCYSAFHSCCDDSGSPNRPGGVRSVLAESVLMRHQLLVLNRSRRRAPNLRALDRLVSGWCALLVLPRRLIRCAIVLKPSTILRFHRALVHRKYRLLFSSKNRARPGPKGPDQDLIKAVIEMKQRNARWGCPRIAEQPALAFGVLINKDVVRRILATQYQPYSDDAGPSWLTVLGHMKDSLHSIDLFRCESVALRTYWVLVVMDQYTRRIVGFGINAGNVDGLALCRMFNRAIRGQATSKYLSSDHDPLYGFHQWQANLRVLGVTEIKTVRYVPISHPFVERLIGTIRRECLDHTLFWNAVDLESKLAQFKDYYNRHRTHSGLSGRTPGERPDNNCVSLKSYGWKGHCSGLFHTPIAA
jgi:putative transposase